MKAGTNGPSTIGEIASEYVKALAPISSRYDSIGEVWGQLLPRNLHAHCRVEAVRGRCLRVVADGSSYVYELQLCKEMLLEELQRLCPGARLQRIEIGVAR